MITKQGAENEMRKKIKYLAVIVLVCAVFSSCSYVALKSESETVPAEKLSMFVEVESYWTWRVVYHKETKVMYAVSNFNAPGGFFTLLVNSDGTPQTWKGV